MFLYEREVMLLLLLFLNLTTGDSQSNLENLKIKSKCVATFLNSRSTKSESFRNTIEDREYNAGEGSQDAEPYIHNFIGQLGSAHSPCTISDNVPDANYCSYSNKGQNSDGRSILVDFNNGRLGNLLSSFASVFSLSRQLDLQTVFPYRTIRELNKWFDLPPQIILESEYCNPCQSLKFIPLDLYLENRNAVDSTGGHCIYPPPYPNLLSLYKQELTQLRRHFQFKSKVQAFAESFIGRVKRKANKTTSVCIHNRRKEYRRHLVSFGGNLVDKNYFNQAADIMKERHKSVVFILVSDDLEWSRKNIVEEDIYYSPVTLSGLSEVDGLHSPGELPLDDLHLIMSEIQKKEGSLEGLDLALLANCDHAINTYGTFGMWGSLLSQGSAIFPELSFQPPPPDYQATKTANMQTWTFINSIVLAKENDRPPKL